MKFPLASSLLSVYLSCALSTAEAPVGHVYLYDRDANQAPTQLQAVAPATARLIFEQRLGLSQFDDITELSQDGLQQLNWFGGQWQAPLQLGKQAPSPAAQVLVFVESSKDALDIMGCASASQCDYAHFTISNPPSRDTNKKLLNELKELATGSQNVKSDGPSDTTFERVADAFMPLKLMGGASLTLVNGKLFIPLVDSNEPQTAEQMRTAIHDLYKIAVDENMSLTIAIFPPSSSKSSTYGSAHSYGKRAAERLHADPEAPMSVSVAKSSSSSSVKTSNDDAPIPFAPSDVLKGILPSCFSTAHACETSTRNCTGHGICYLKSRDASHDNRECWACGCKATVTTNNGMKKTTNWGGPACQKKDVVVPFWILAGFSILLVGIISWAVGLLYSMGDEELPSVIGAGVSGPKAK